LEPDDLERDLERCRVLLDSERFEEAFRVAQRLLPRAPAEPEVVAVFSDAAIAAERPADAVRACRALLRNGEEDIEILEWLSKGLFDLSLPEEARRTCRRILTREPENYVALDVGLATVQELGDPEEAADIIDLAIACPAADRHLRYETAVARLMRGEDEFARRTFEEFLAEDPDDVRTYVTLMRLHYLAGRYEDVASLARTAEARDLAHEDIDFHAGLALLAREEPVPAARRFVAAIRRNPSLPEFHLNLAQALRDAGHHRLAMAMLDRELALDDTNPAAYAELAWCAEDLGAFADAVRFIRAAIDRAPEWPLYQHSLAELLLKADPGSSESGSTALRAVALDEKHAAGWMVLGRLAAGRGDLDEAERLLRRAAGASDATAEDEGWLGLVLAERERRDEAAPLLERALRANPRWDPPADALGRIRGKPLPRRFEIRCAAKDSAGRPVFRVVHVVAADERHARQTASASIRRAGGAPFRIREVLELGFEVDRPPGVVWDSGLSATPRPRPPAP
jgi:tetratricopeptide (TPR) repeat protein